MDQGRGKGALSENVYLKIKEMIYYNQLAPGQKLIYGRLARKLNVSVTPVIQALTRLETSNLVEYEPNKGYFVGEITQTEAHQLYKAREALELYIIPSIVRNLTADKLNQMRQIFKKYQNGDRRSLILFDAQFHLKIAEYAQNEVIYHLLEKLFERIYLKYRPEYLGEDRIKAVLKEHRRILNALGRGDIEDATNTVREHIQNGMHHVIQSLEFASNPLFITGERTLSNAIAKT